MTDRQLNFLRMWPVARGVMDLNPNPAIWDTNDWVVQSKARAQQAFDEILALAGLTEADLHGATEEKLNLWSDTAKLGVHLNVGTKAWAMNKTPKDLVLAAAMHYQKSDLDSGAIQEVLVRMNFIKGKVALIPVLDLVKVNILPSEITTYATKIDALTLANPQWRIAVSVRAANRGQIIEKFKVFKAEIGVLDGLVHTYRYTQGVFVAAYDNGRKILDLGKGAKTDEAILHPREHIAWFHNKYLPGDTLTLRNHSILAKIKAYLSDSTDVPATGGFEIDPEHEFKMEIPTDFNGPFGHYIIIVSMSDTDDASVTGILAKGKSDSDAPSPPLT